MTSTKEAAAVDPQMQADLEAVSRHAFHGAALDPEIAHRVEERTARITEEISRPHGVIDDASFQGLLDDDDTAP